MGCAGNSKEPEGCNVTPYEERSCTDLFFLLLFLGGWGTSFFVLGAAIDWGGNPNKIIRGVDTYGRICGESEGVEDLPYAVWPNPLYTEIKFCAASCDESLADNDGFMLAPYETEDYLDYCLPTDASSLSSVFNSTVDVSSMMGGSAADLDRAIEDMYTTWTVIMGSVFIALFLSFMYAKGLKLFGTCMVYTAFILVAAMGFWLAYQLVLLAEYTREGEFSDYADGMMYTGYAVGGLTLLLVFVLIYLRKRIDLAIQIVKEGGAALNDMKCLLLFPIVPAILGSMYLAYWITVSLYIFSVSYETSVEWPLTDEYVAKAAQEGSTWNLPLPEDAEPWDTRADYIDLVWDRELEPYFAFHVFHGLWMVQFLIYINYLVVSIAISKWYFTRPNERVMVLGDSPVTKACAMTTRFHLGSIAIGSLLIATIQFIRACVKYIEEKSKAAGEPNACQKAMFCCIQCCLKCVQCCMDKVNKNAFCWMAIWGDNYGTSACSSFELIWANMARATIINVVGGYLLFSGKVVVSLASTAICAYLIDSYMTVNSLLFPCAVIFVVSLMVAHLFMVEFDTTIDTLFMCFLIDEKFNPNNSMYASEDLQRILNINAKAFEKNPEKETSDNFSSV